MKKINKLLVSIFLLLIIPLTNINNITLIETRFNEKLATSQETQTLKGIIVFIEFSNTDEFEHNHLDDEQSVNNAYTIFNSDELFEMNTPNGIIKVPSFKKYYQTQSYGKLNITSEIFPKENGKVISYKDSHPIGYYLKYNEQNQIGYKDKTESLERETELINNATAYISNMISSFNITADELDTDSDGKVDAIFYIVEGQPNLPSSISWNDLLWSHKMDNTGVTQKILGKNVTSYALLYADDYTQSASLFSLNRGIYGTLIHEFGHTLGYMDLYRYESTLKPVGFYDIMGNSIGSNPQNFLTYYISEYRPSTNWHNRLPVINKTTQNITLYKPEFIDPNEKRAIKIQMDGNNDEFFVVEYHERQNTYDTYRADSSGIIIYRVNEKFKYYGSTNGTNDHVYIFRPNETGPNEGNGDLSSATLNMNRPTFGSDLDLNNTTFDNKSIYFSNGANSGIKIEVISETNNSVTFNVTFPEMEGNGTKEDPYLINDINTFIYLMSQDTKNKYYKLTNNLDFKDIDNFPSINFEGNLDGNNETLLNLKTTETGLFNNIGNYEATTYIKNLNIENITVYSSKGDYLGGLANVANNIIINNVHLKSGSVTNEGNSINSLASTGAFIGNVNNTTIIENSSSNLKVSANKNVGGFIGINMNATIKNSFTTSLVTGSSNVGAFIGIQAINDNTYNTPQNVYYKENSLPASGGYASGFHNLNVLDEFSLSKEIRSISLEEITLLESEETSLDIKVTPAANLTYSVTIEDETIAKYENNKITGYKAGTTFIYIDINVGTNKMRLTSNITVKSQENISEQDILNYLGLTKKESYVIGFAPNTKVEGLKTKISKLSGVTLKNIKNDKYTEIKSGILGTGMNFTLNFNNVEYTYIIVIKGDVNGDGLIYATDYVKVKNHIMGKTSLTGAYLLASDINNDGNVYATDYVLIKNHIMGKNEIIQK